MNHIASQATEYNTGQVTGSRKGAAPIPERKWGTSHRSEI